MIYNFGQKSDKALTHEVLDNILSDAQNAKTDFDDISIDSIIELLGKLSILWRKNSTFYNKALTYLNSQEGFSPSMNELTLDLLEGLLKEENLKQRVFSDFKSFKVLDQFTSVDGYKGRLKYSALGVLLHVTAGNVFLGCIDSLIMGLLTKNVSLIKLSSSNTFLPFLFLESLESVDRGGLLSSKVSLLTWKGGDSEIEDYIKPRVDAIIAWGGAQMAQSYATNLPRSVKFIEHGPKISFQILDAFTVQNSKLESLCDAIARDVCLWDQSACANSQILYIEKSACSKEFKDQLGRAFSRFKLTAGQRDADQDVEILKEVHKSLYSEFKSGVSSMINDEFIIHFDHQFDFRLSPLGRTLIVKMFDSDSEILSSLREYRSYLQTCALGVRFNQRDRWMTKLSSHGVNRFTRIGEMLSSLDGSPHDGSFSLLELTKVHCDEYIPTVEEFALEIIEDIPFYNQQYSSFSELPLITGEDLAKNSLITNSAFKNVNSDEGIIFSSGGTSGNPKFCFYTSGEFKAIASRLASSYQDLGLEKKSVVANLFMAGNMWSSFSVIQYALEQCHVVQLPIGGSVSANDFSHYAADFNIDVIFGLPSLIVSLANECPNLKIKQIFYAGEAFSEEKREFIKRLWGTEEIYSAGYASVDVGPIGYQDATCNGNEHILFDDIVHLEVVDGEGVITSKARRAMPVIRYRTGDRIELLLDTENKFNLLGRIDNLINIWGCRFSCEEFNLALKQFDIPSDSYQIVLKNFESDNQNFDKLSLHIHLDYQNKFEDISIMKALYDSCKDIRNTILFEDFLFWSKIEYGELIFNSKTGKLKQVFDYRSQ